MPILGADAKEQLRSTFKDSVLILVYEFIGTTILTILVCNFMSETQFYGRVDYCGLLLGMFVTILFSARISGSHYNPCITASYMVGNVKHGNFNRYLGFLYIAAQLAGGLIGGFIGTLLSGYQGKSIHLDLHIGNFFFQQIFLEVMGSFFLVFMYLSSTDVKTKFTQDAAIQTIILSGSYLGSMLLAGKEIRVKASPVNPAIALGIFVFNGFDAKNLKTLVIFLSAPLGGSFLALLFFRYIYKTTTEAIE